MAVAALVLFVVFLVLVAFVRVMIQLRRTGDLGDRHRTDDPAQRRIASVAGLGAIALGAGSPVAALLGLPVVVDSSAVEVVGVALAVMGIAATFGAQLAMGDAWRAGVDPGERTELVTSGPFRLVRNPILTAVMITCAGLALMVPTVVGFAGLAAVVVANELLVRLVEEPHLRRVHGEAYEQYAASVGRFVPGVGRLDR